MTYLLGVLVILVWGMIIYRVFKSVGAGDEDAQPATVASVKQEPFNDFSFKTDTTRLQLNYRDPFGITLKKDSISRTRKTTYSEPGKQLSKAAINWGFIQYIGYIRNAKSKKLLTLVNINGENEIMAENEQKKEVRLIKNLRDSIKIRYYNKIKFIHLKNTAQ